MLKNTLRGTGVAIVTPFNEKGEIDFVSLKNVLRHVVQGNVDYLVLLGTTAESVTLDIEEKKDIISFCVEHNEKKLPIVIGIGGNDTTHVEKMLSTLPLQNACAIMSVSPYYNKPSQEGIFQHFKQLASISPKPLLLYNVPSRTGRNIESKTVVRLANECPNIQGIKEACDNIKQSLDLIGKCPKDFLITSGEDAIAIPLLLSGMDGLISVAGNAFPRQISAMTTAALNGNRVESLKNYFSIQEAIDLMFQENNPAGVKTFLAKMGLIKNHLRLPLVPLSLDLQEKVAICLSSMNGLL